VIVGAHHPYADGGILGKRSDGAILNPEAGRQAGVSYRSEEHARFLRIQVLDAVVPIPRRIDHGL
jgi:hypothetical protein